ncbi:MAG TPA: FAD-dependent oxidoreductase [Candidatus Kapabacteria bacterium]|jgi:ferredoxin-NADP reductase|nr:FAD-dependent oxidoreductase [Candidatus Kapabacteria bacterium]
MEEKRLKLLGSEEIANGTRAFHLERPQGFNYESGQTIDLTLVDPTDLDDEGPVRTFSLVSAPHEHELMFATRMRDSAFKRTIGSAAAGAELAWDGPYGSFIMHKNASKPAVFLAGGIGITPFISMVKSATHQRLPHQIYLFHSNHTPEDSPFLDELIALDHSNPNFQYIPTMTDLTDAMKWEGERGIIGKDLLERHIGDLKAPIYYMAGPPGFVTAMRKMLVDSKTDEDNIRFEEFPGY